MMTLITIENYNLLLFFTICQILHFTIALLKFERAELTEFQAL